jgi:hypothetical protein
MIKTMTLEDYFDYLERRGLNQATLQSHRSSIHRFITRMDIPEEYLKHLSPLGWEHVNLTGDYIWNLKQRISLENFRPLRKERIRTHHE